MKVPISLVLIVVLIASGCASMHDPATRGSESALIDTTVTETGKQEAETSETTAISSAEVLEWAQAQSASNLGSSKFFGLLIVGWTLGLYALWKLIFD
ncbi:MAG: hypothetical protein F4X56_00950 [Gammaproteobacteria bacterium]|nr:hypothetical protein [Gammaproteobacteria bacterium]MYC24468.1 hypothetical protein [Gammaproteobacteria bacterium]